MGEALFWAWGFGPKSPAAIVELERVSGGSIRNQRDQIPDYARNAWLRLRGRRSTSTARTFAFGARSVGQTLGGIVIRCRDHGVKARQIVLEDHGFEHILFMGRDAITTRTLPQYRWNFEVLRECLAPNAEIFLMHCQAFADGGALAQAISHIVGCPVYGGDLDQLIGNRALEGQAYRATGSGVQPVGSIDPAVLHYD